MVGESQKIFPHLFVFSLRKQKQTRKDRVSFQNVYLTWTGSVLELELAWSEILQTIGLTIKHD